MINRPKWNGSEWVWTCPFSYPEPWSIGTWQTTDKTFVGAIKKGRRHLLSVHWIMYEFRKGRR